MQIPTGGYVGNLIKDDVPLGLHVNMTIDVLYVVGETMVKVPAIREIEGIGQGIGRI